MVDQEIARSDEGVPAAKKSKICLRFRSSMLDGGTAVADQPAPGEQETRHLPVALAVVLIDETQPSRLATMVS